MLREIQIPDDLMPEYVAFDEWNEPDPSNRLCGLGKLNVFIGPNNAGKSRLLRAMFSASETFCADNSSSDQNTDIIREAQRELVAAIRSLPDGETALQSQKVAALQELRRAHPRLKGTQGTDARKRQQITQAEDLQNNFMHNWSRLQHALETEFSARGADFRLMLRHLTNGLRRDPFSGDSEQNRFQVQMKHFYIPSLRGLRPLGSDDPYLTATMRDYFPKAPRTQKEVTNVSMADRLILTGQAFYEDIRKHLLGDPKQRRMVADFERFVSQTFFQGKPLTLMPRDGSNVIHINLGNDADQPIHELGDGIQHVLILLLPLFLHKEKNVLLFIEEPELYLHPGFQRVFIETALSVGDNVQVFVATHSHQFLDMTLDRSRCSIYKCEKGAFQRETGEPASFRVSLRTCDDFSILRDLGVQNSSVFLSNCTIWVEGVTDRMYLRHYLDLYQSHVATSGRTKFLEDLHFSFVEYGGGNITHWSFLDGEKGIDVTRLCGEAFLIADKDERKEERHSQLRSVLGNRLHILPCREIENLISAEVLRHVVLSHEGKDCLLKEFDRGPAFLKTPIGKFIESKVLPDNVPSRRRTKTSHPYSEKSGTVKDKAGFCTRAIAEMKAWSDLTDEARTLTEVIHKFIESKNLQTPAI